MLDGGVGAAVARLFPVTSSARQRRQFRRRPRPDVEILNAIEPGLATTGGPLILASSPHARRGVLWDVFRKQHGPDGDPLTLVARGASRMLAGEFPRELFRKHGIHYELAKPTKSELFRDLLPLLNSGRVTLPRSDRLVLQIVSLERRVSAAVATQHSLPSGRYSLLGPDFHRLDRASFAWRTHSITSSARPSSEIGKVRPSVFAVFRLITSSTLVDC
jgi:hypothetical protein